MWFNKDGHFDKSGKIEIRRCPMQSQKRRQDTEAFKHEAVRLRTEHGYGVTEATRNLGINAHMVGRWQRQSEQHKHAIKGNGHLSGDHKELQRLRKENPRLRMEREILKKTVSFFASESS
jgi:transposase